MSDLGDILKNDGDKPISEEQLLLYLEGKLSGEALHAVEKQLADSEFVSDALEGLEKARQAGHLPEQVADLKRKLRQQLDNRQARRHKRKISGLSQQMTYVLLILLLCILGYVVLKMLLK